MKINDTLSGFTLKNIINIKEQKAKLYYFVHDKTKAELVWLDNKVENKLFSIAFKTLPNDDTGVFHILEHSVLCGSKKYPVKEPFVELLKSSMNTFLNAMTFPDKTVYPVSSKNKKDFFNLMSVYLDAVFNPLIYENPSIFYQEGWHYEIRDKDAVPTYKGVVFNEMKGAFANIDRIIDTRLNKELFKDNIYQYESGGDPKYIPDLTYENFIDNHKKYYHPSNSKIYLDGDIDIEKTLKYINDNYLSKYDYKESNFIIEYNRETEFEDLVLEYEISEEESLENKVHFTLGKIVSKFDEKEKNLAIQILTSYLASSNESPLSKAILSKNLGQDLILYLSDQIKQPYLYLRVANSEENKKELVINTIFDTIDKICKEGLDKEQIEAIINRLEFKYREASEPRGLINNLNILSSWLYGGDLDTYLTYDEAFKNLRKNINSSYYENLLKEIINKDMVLLTSLPSKELSNKKKEEENKRLLDAKNSWSDEELDTFINLNKKLDIFQESLDTKENLAKLPSLNLSDVNSTLTQRPLGKYDLGPTKILIHPSSSKISYLSFYFKIYNIDAKDLTKVSLLSQILEELETENYDVNTLKKEIRKNIGSLSFSCDAYNNEPYFIIRTSILNDKLDISLKLIEEILFKTQYTPEKIKELVIQADEYLKQVLISSGHQFSIGRALAHFSINSYLKENISGFSSYQNIHDFKENFENNIDNYITFVKDFIKSLSKSKLTVSTSDNINVDNLKDFIYLFNSQEPTRCEYKLEDFATNEAIEIPSLVSYSAMAYKLNNLTNQDKANLHILSNILSFSYLWNKVRVQNGAYGAGLIFNDSGAVSFYSYRDPSPYTSVNIYKETYKFIEDFINSDEDLDKFIIGSLSKMEPLISEREENILADLEYFINKTFEKKSEIRRFMLESKKEDLKKYIDIFKDIALNSSICLVAENRAIDKFENIKKYTIK